MKKALQHLKKDPVMRTLIERVGPYTMEFRDPTFSTLVRSIVYQQLSGKVASVILKRLIDALPGGEVTPRNILRLRPDRMRKLGLSRAKTEYIRDLARLTAKGEVVFETLAALEDAAVIEHLTRVKGVGVWTAHMFLMFALQRPNVLPVGDLGSAFGHSQSLRPGGAPDSARNRTTCRAMASLLFGRRLVPLAKPRRWRPDLTGVLRFLLSREVMPCH